MGSRRWFHEWMIYANDACDADRRSSSPFGLPPRHGPPGCRARADGRVFYAGARTLLERLPRPGGKRSVVVLRLRGHTKIGATFVEVLAGYADELAQAEGRLYLAGVDHDARALIEHTRKVSPKAAERIFEATPIVGESTEHALEAGEAWLIGSSRRDDEPPAAVS